MRSPATRFAAQAVPALAALSAAGFTRQADVSIVRSAANGEDR